MFPIGAGSLYGERAFSQSGPMPFASANPSLAQALSARQYSSATPVQAAVMAASPDADLLVSAQTGSGKTVAFGLAMAGTLLGEAETFGPAEAPQALIVAPTRELALQVQRELVWLYEKTGARIVSCVGGMDPRAERRDLSRGAHIVVGTPGRLRDHLERGALDIASLRLVVLDEADEMLDLGFREDLEFLLDAMPTERRTLLFSATIAKDIAALARRYQTDAERIDTVDKSRAHADIDYQAVRVAPNDVEHAIVNLLRFHDQGAAIVFCSTREAVNRLHANLSERKFAAVALSGEFTQNERNHALQALRDGRARVCVATDVAARGLDLPDLGLVIHYDLPRNRETLLHRSGRTGRAGRKGLCALLVPHTRRRVAERLFQAAKIDAAWMDAPSPDEIRARDNQRLLDHSSFSEAARPEEKELADALLTRRSPDELALALSRLFLATLPAPEDLLDGGGPAETRREKTRDPRGGDDRRGPFNGRWFAMNVGRRENADPKWLIPMICRLGHVTKREIGAIRVQDRETRFEIDAQAAKSFMDAFHKAVDPEVRIIPSEAPAMAERPRAPRPAEPRGDRRPPPAHNKPGGKPKPYQGKQRRDR